MELFNKYNARYLLSPKILYIAIALFYYTFHTNRSKYIKDNFNINPGVIGLYMVIPQTLSLLTGIKIGSISDKYGIQKYILLFAVSVGTSVFITMLTLPKITFYLYFTLFTFYFILVSISLPLIDKITYDFLEKTENASSNNYGSQRVFNTITFLFMGFIIEAIIKQDEYGVNHYNGLPIFALFAGVVAFIAVSLLVKNLDRQESSSGTLSSSLVLFKNFEYTFLITLIFFNGITRAAMTQFLSHFYDSQMKFKAEVSKGSKSKLMYFILSNKLALLNTAGMVVEIPLFFMSSVIIGRIGYLWPLLLAQVFQMIRMVGYSLLGKDTPNAFYISLGLELCKGFNFGLTQMSATKLAHSLCPSYLKSTSQLVYNGVFIGLGSAVSYLLAYFALGSGNVKSYHLLFIGCAIITFLCICLMVLKYGFIDGYLTNYQKLQEKIDKLHETEEDIIIPGQSSFKDDQLYNKKETLRDIKV
ncbi:hypothetical protein HERIO_570 [Hepatospora eriocheir]|uniref:Major facilitator superfamily associated domain-containing protein n=1 Tax=Hepatospora eriocheir TaxID=1081669 RepID=A0A1X0QCR7_9MICR|nr:hypothetical protein HERIO_570 [Hepatospora eriocheir]